MSDAWIGHKFGDYHVWLGRMRPWMLREDVVSSKRQALVDRSLVAKRFGLSRGVGVTVRRVEESVRGVYGHESGVDEDLLVLTGGFVHFIHSHDLRVTMDVGYGFNAVADDWSSTVAGWCESDAGQIVVRSQLQLLF